MVNPRPMPGKTAVFHFFGSLNDLLPVAEQDVDFTIDFQGAQSVKHLFESCGVPHTEVARLAANGVPISQKYIVQDGDRIEVHPPDLPLMPKTDPASHPIPVRFVLDNHLGKLADYLRLLGFDAFYRNDVQDEELAHISSQERRILLTRDRRLLMRTIVTQGYCVRNDLPRQQVVEILSRFGLFSAIAPFGRCVHCNALLQPVPKEQILERLEPLTRLYFAEFQRCPACDQVYWKGSHYMRIQEFIDELRQYANENGP
jgi:uncharacterized protein with PIN domain/sulfur carrier protein ThiS